MPADDARAELAGRLAELLAIHDPLEAWLTESHYDDHYWDKEARALAIRLSKDMTLVNVRAAVVAVLEDAFPHADVDTGLLRGDSIEVLAEACWRLLRTASH